MNEREIIARGERAKAALDEFVIPTFDYARQHYMSRIVEIAAQELNPRTREEKITVLSQGIRVLNEVQSGVAMAMHEGGHAREQLIRAEKLEDLSDARRRLIAITG